MKGWRRWKSELNIVILSSLELFIAHSRCCSMPYALCWSWSFTVPQSTAQLSHHWGHMNQENDLSHNPNFLQPNPHWIWFSIPHFKYLWSNTQICKDSKTLNPIGNIPEIDLGITCNRANVQAGSRSQITPTASPAVRFSKPDCSKASTISSLSSSTVEDVAGRGGVDGASWNLLIAYWSSRSNSNDSEKALWVTKMISCSGRFQRNSLNPAARSSSRVI